MSSCFGSNKGSYKLHSLSNDEHTALSQSKSGLRPPLKISEAGDATTGNGGISDDTSSTSIVCPWRFSLLNISPGPLDLYGTRKCEKRGRRTTAAAPEPPTEVGGWHPTKIRSTRVNNKDKKPGNRESTISERCVISWASSTKIIIMC